MKKILAITSLILAAVMLTGILCSCSSTDKAIIGTWKSDSDTLIFKSDGTLIHIDYYGEDTFSYTASNGKIKITTVHNGDRLTEPGTYSISGDTLILTFSAWNDGHEVTYKKV